MILIQSYGRRESQLSFSSLLPASLLSCFLFDGVTLMSFQHKGYSDKRGWSFRKRSARHRVLSNTVVSEIPSTGNKESPESAAINFQTPVDSTVAEKTSVPQWADEKTQLSTSFNSKASETVIASENESKVDVNVDESVAIVIQAAIRGFLVHSQPKCYCCGSSGE